MTDGARDRCAAASTTTEASGVSDTTYLTDAIDQLKRERDEARAEVERLRSTAREYIDLLKSQQRELLGDGFEEVIAELEQCTTGSQRLAEALKRLDTACLETSEA